MAVNAIPITQELMEAFISEYATANRQMTTNYTSSTDETTGLLERLSMVFSLDQEFEDTTYNRFWGEDLPYGAATEEYAIDPQMPQKNNPEGTDLLTRVDQPKRPVYFATAGKDVIDLAISVSNIEYKRSLANPGEYGAFVARLFKAFEDSMTLYRNDFAKQGFDNSVTLIKQTQDSNVAVFAANTAYKNGTHLKSGAGADAEFGVVYRDIPASGGPQTWSAAMSGGYIVPSKMVSAIADIIDNKTAADFILELKCLAEKMKHPRHGGSLSGRLVGTKSRLVGFVKEGVLPRTEIETYAGAFNQKFVASPIALDSVVDFGEGNEDVVAVVIDERAVRAHVQINDAGSFVNPANSTTKYYRHIRSLIRTSPNVFAHVFTKAPDTAAYAVNTMAVKATTKTATKTNEAAKAEATKEGE